MRTYERAHVTLQAFLGIPLRRTCCNAALLKSCKTHLYRAVHPVDKNGYRKIVSFLPVDMVTHLGNDRRSIFRTVYLLILKVCPFGGNLDFMNTFRTLIDRIGIHLDDLASLGKICLLRSRLHFFYSGIYRKEVRYLKERRLKHRVRMAPKTELLGDRRCIYRKQPYLLLGKKPLYPVRKFGLKLIIRPCAVKQEYPALLYLIGNIILLDKALVMACNDVSGLNVITSTDRFLGKTKV